jgi:protoheme IX farnesyltransferase
LTPFPTSPTLRLPFSILHPSSFVLRDIITLFKPRITISMLITTFAASLLAIPHSPHPTHLHLLPGLLLGLGLVISGASAMNQWLERDTDKLFRRTRDRPLPAGRVSPLVALAIAFVTAPIGTYLLYAFAGPVPASLATFAFFVYWALYTPLKRLTGWAWLPGAVSGATPTLIGWTAFAAPFSPTPWILFSVLFLWQIPHTVGLQWWQLDDYRRAGFPTIVREGASPLARFTSAVLPVLALLSLSLLVARPTFAGILYGAVCVALGVSFLRAALRFAIAPAHSSGRSLFLASLAFVSGAFFALTLLSLT